MKVIITKSPRLKAWRKQITLSTPTYSVLVCVCLVTAYYLQYERKLFMNVIMFLFIGLCSGFFAGKIVEGRGFGVLGDIVIGIIGAFVGGFFFTNAEFINGSLSGSILTSTLGSIIFLLIAGVFRSVGGPRKA